MRTVISPRYPVDSSDARTSSQTASTRSTSSSTRSLFLGVLLVGCLGVNDGLEEEDDEGEDARDPGLDHRHEALRLVNDLTYGPEIESMTSWYAAWDKELGYLPFLMYTMGPLRGSAPGAFAFYVLRSTFLTSTTDGERTTQDHTRVILRRYVTQIAHQASRQH